MFFCEICPPGSTPMVINRTSLCTEVWGPISWWYEFHVHRCFPVEYSRYMMRWSFDRVWEGRIFASECVFSLFFFLIWKHVCKTVNLRQVTDELRRYGRGLFSRVFITPATTCSFIVFEFVLVSCCLFSVDCSRSVTCLQCFVDPSADCFLKIQMD